MNKRVVQGVKIAAMLIVAVVVIQKVYDSWGALAGNPITIDWRWSGVALFGFAGSMLTSAFVWRWLAYNMGDRAPVPRLIAAYTFSQMGKYIPGKVALLFMRIDRAGRFGMSPATCTLSTLLENALYMISGGLVGTLAIVRIAGELKPAQRPLVWPVTIAALVLLSTACVPAVFYNVVNRLLRKMKKPEVPRGQWLRAGTLVLPVIGFVPCWFFGGLALWASTQAVHITPLAEGVWFAGAYALSVIIGMASMLPGGAGIRDALLGAAVTLQLAPAVGHDRAVLLAGVVAILQRLFQIIVEIVLGILGGMLTAKPPGADTPPAAPEAAGARLVPSE
jgi:uncharacterized membrane protein YbhN (UPF0104 family)